ncbi:MAG: M20/M25/M40 family metallo-hydrolase [Phycisphaerae bacterium]|nr:M20/M25/M40 family metallo-hydrolase [Phycisphaerae bacterium]
MKPTLRKLATLTLVLLVSAPAWADRKPDSAAEAKAFFTADAYMAHVKYLASDELAGRAPASEGSEKAAEYIIKNFKKAGCRPTGADGAWFQPFDVRRGKRLVDEKASLRISGMDRTWKVREDWIPFPFTEMKDVDGPLAFAGYGISADRFGYDDYEGFDPEGKSLLIFRYEPKGEDPEAEFGGEKPSRHATFIRKARKAAKRGAKALLVVDPPNHDPGQDKLYEFSTYSSLQTYRLPIVHITRKMANAILRQAGMPDLKTLQEKLDGQRQSLSKDIGLTVRLCPGVEPNTLRAKNVIGMIRGDGSTGETIVVGAHRDHLGIVPRQFQRKDMTPMIHNGADDNASGTAAIMELARAVGRGSTLRRNVLFIAFDAEEMGLLGSKHFVEHPTINLDDVCAMLNFDMIGRLSQNKYTVFGIPTAKAFSAIVEKAAEAVGLEYKAPSMVAGYADHAPFIKHHIPAMFAFTGVHKDYHQPEDDWERIDGDGAVRILQMWYKIIVELANMEERPVYTEPSRKPDASEDVRVAKPAVEENKEFDRDGETAEDKNDDPDDLDEPPSRSEMRVALGIVPDMVGDDKPGMIVESVRDGGAAKAGGVMGGDRIIRIGDEDIRDIYGYMRAMQRHEPGDVVDVVVIRNGEKRTLKITLQASKARHSDD